MDHLIEWMKLQEEANREMAVRIIALEKRLGQTDAALIHLMQFVGMIDSSPATPEENEWARKIIEERGADG